MAAYALPYLTGLLWTWSFSLKAERSEMHVAVPDMEVKSHMLCASNGLPV